MTLLQHKAFSKVLIFNMKMILLLKIETLSHGE